MHELPKSFSSRGADMGRAAKPGPADLPYKFSLQRLRIDAGGYDQGGAYWGHGAPLFWACDESTHSAPVEVFLRAADREAVKAKIRESYPAARFYR
jgi:hypothetical protein